MTKKENFCSCRWGSSLPGPRTLDPRLGHHRHEYFLMHVSAKSPSKISPNPPEFISEVLVPVFLLVRASCQVSLKVKLTMFIPAAQGQYMHSSRTKMMILFIPDADIYRLYKNISILYLLTSQVSEHPLM